MDEKQLYTALKQHFGFTEFRKGQLATVKSVLAGQNTLAILPTGGGKSLLYQLPAYLLPGAVLVVSPLISLMQDQVDRLHRNGEKRVLMLSGQGGGQARQQQLANLANAKFIFASPELLANPAVIDAFHHVQLSLLTVDEAHCISQWGPDFRPEYLLLKELRHQLGDPVTLLLTATATPRVRHDILAKLGLPQSAVTVIKRSVNRPNLFLAVEDYASSKDKQAGLAKLVRQLPGAGIIYFASRRLATTMAEWLRENSSLAVAAYHAGMPAADRFRIQQQFMADQLQVVCATSAFGMGIDKADIRFVIHYHLPTSLENYLQEIGRAGRDGQQSVAILLHCPGDEQLTRQLTQVDFPTATRFDQVQAGKLPVQALGTNYELFDFYRRHQYDYQRLKRIFSRRQQLVADQLGQVRRYLELTTCRRQFILTYFGEIPAVQANNCCDIDEPDWQAAPLLPPRQLVDHPEEIGDWATQLRQLLNLS